MAKSIKYNTDGTGRDGYVTLGNGGFTNPNKIVAMDPRVVFKHSLRGYEPDGDYLKRRKHQKHSQHNRYKSSNPTQTLQEAMEAVDRHNKIYNAVPETNIARRDRNSVDILAKHRRTIEP